MCFLLETSRLSLRPPQERDIPAIVTWIGDWDVAKYLSRAPHPYTEAHGQDFILEAGRHRALGQGFAFAFLRKEDGVLVGMGGVHLREDGFELGYWLGKPFWGQGYASEAALRLLEFAFHDLKLERIGAAFHQDNQPSGHVLAKLGFVPVGTGPRDCLARGEKVLCNLVELRRSEFRQKKKAA
jgi:RimJ/RimL family protein N-acetyltransferase